jgi:hypothetical protein
MELKTIEEWKKELLPYPKEWQKLPEGKRQYFEGVWMPGEETKAGSKDWLYNSAKILKRWAVGEEMTKEEFEAGLAESAVHYVR